MWIGKLFSQVRGLASDLLQIARFLLERFVTSLRGNVALALLALLLAAALWVFITGEQNPPRTDILNSDIPVEPVNVPKDLDVVGPIPSVRVRVRAPDDVWERLSTTSFTATVDLSESEAGVVRVPVNVKPRSRQVRVLTVLPEMAEVRLEALKRQTVAVKVNFIDSPTLGYTTEAPQTSPEKVTVLGPESLIDQVDFAVADVNLGGEKVTIERSYKLVPRTERGHQIEGVTLEPASVDVRVPIKQQLFFQSFSIVAETRGAPASGYWLSGISIEPQMATVFGPRDVLQSLGFLKTKPIDISNTSSSIIRQVEIDLPPGATLLGSRTVEARVTISPVRGSITLRLTPEIDGLPGGRKASTSPATVDVVLTGDLPALNRLAPGDVRAVVNVKNMSGSSSSAEVKVSAPPGIEVTTIVPNPVMVAIQP